MSGANNYIDRLMEDIKRLPPKAKDAMIWLIENIDIVNEITGGESLTPETAEKYQKIALEKEDLVMWGLIQYQQIKIRVDKADKSV